MNMYSSRPPFNDDPEPMLEPLMGGRAAFADEQFGWTHSPRPEFDRPQYNPTNVILLAFRSHTRHLGRQGLTLAGYWAHRLGKGHLPVIVDEASDREIAHARKVLTRLAAL